MGMFDPLLWNLDDRHLRSALARAWRNFPASDLAQVMGNLALDVYEKDNTLVVKASLPGLEQKDVKVTIENDVLTIAGERKEEKEVKEEHWYLKEMSTGSFQRSIRLPHDCRTDAVEAKFDKGVLVITIPRKPADKPRAIEVKVKSEA